MKKTVLLIGVALICLLLVGCIQEQGYRLVSTGQVNRSDFRHDISLFQNKEQYFGNGFYYSTEFLRYASEDDASSGMTRIIEQYNPAQITLGGKYIKIKEFPIVDDEGNVQGNGPALYFYQSGNLIIVVDASRENGGDAFVEWYITKYIPN